MKAIKTVSLGTAKLLKENGFRQELNPGDRYWFVSPSGKIRLLLLSEDEDLPYSQYEWYKAPSTDELLEELPLIDITITFNDGLYIVWHKHLNREFYNTILCEALALMWLHLRKEGLI